MSQGKGGKRGNVGALRCHLTWVLGGDSKALKISSHLNNSVILQPQLCFGPRNREKGVQVMGGVGVPSPRHRVDFTCRFQELLVLLSGRINNKVAVLWSCTGYGWY